MRFFYTIGKILFWLPFRIFYPTKVLGKSNLPRGKQIVVSNHLSWIDIPVTGLGLPGFRRILAKKEIGKWWITRLLVKLVGAILVDRAKPDLEAIRTCVGHLKNNGGLLIYPESHRNRMGNTELQDVKGGASLIAIKGKSPIVPIIINNKPKMFRRNFVLVGRPFELTEYYGKRLDTPTIEEAGEIVADNMRITQAVIRDFVDNKRWKKANRLSWDELYNRVLGEKDNEPDVGGSIDIQDSESISNVTIAKNSGFCFGVKKAVDLAFEHAGPNTYTYGEIIHNESVTGKLAELGVKIYCEGQTVTGKPKIIIRSHGVGRAVYDKLHDEGYEVLDATCPYVKKIHDIVAKHHSDGYSIIIIGRPDHPEVVGINGWCSFEASVIEDESEVDNLAKNTLILSEKLCVVCQTTFLGKKYLSISEKIRKYASNTLEIFDTICYTTSIRQDEAADLAQKCTVMLVVGSKSSSNTGKLLDICKAHCKRAYLIDSSDKLQDILLNPDDIIGIVGGASAQEELIQEVYNFGSQFFGGN